MSGARRRFAGRERRRSEKPVRPLIVAVADESIVAIEPAAATTRSFTAPPSADEKRESGECRRRIRVGLTKLLLDRVHHRNHARGGCVIGNLSTTLSDTHDGFRRRLAECFDEMAREFQPHLAAAARAKGCAPGAETTELAHYIVSVIEGAIMLARTHRDTKLPACQFAYLKQHLRRNLDG